MRAARVEAEVDFVEDEVTKRSQKFVARAVFAVSLVLSVACGQNSSQTLPYAPNPNGTGNLTPIVTNPQNDTRIPDWVSNSVALTLPTCSGNSTTCYQNQSLVGLAEFVTEVFTPLVETFFNLQLTNGFSSRPTGNVNIGFEHLPGYSYATLPSFDAASSLTSGQLDMIFSDTLGTVRVTGTVYNDQVQSGEVYYRIRQNGETQCQSVTYTCYSEYTYPWGGTYQVTRTCNANEVPSQATVGATCKSYMTLGTSTVKHLGSFSSTYSQWVQ